MIYLPLKTVKSILNIFNHQLKGYSVKKYFLNGYEQVEVIEDSLVLYIGIIKSEMPVCLNAKKEYQDRIYNSFLGIPRENGEYYELFIEELTYNTIGWKYTHTKFVNKLEKMMRIENLGLDIHYTKFRGYKRLYWCPEEPTLAEKISEQLPELNLRERYELWEGLLYYFIIFEVEDVNGNIDFGVAYTRQNPTSYVVNMCRSWIKNGFQQGDIRMDRGKFIRSLESWKGVKRQVRLERYLSYFYVEKYFREKDDTWRYADSLLESAYEGAFANEEKSTYLRPINKWKTEEIVFNFTKKLYPSYKVIYQHRPHFLKSKKGGQLSYDIFISGIDVAIEYQGKQHFEPIDFFGGEDAFKRNLERDEEKRELSAQHGVKLVYINYWETVTPQLIREKVDAEIRVKKGAEPL